MARTASREAGIVSPRMWEYAVTFEFAEAKPETARGELEAGAAPTAAARALRAAKKQCKHARAASIVVLLFPKERTK